MLMEILKSPHDPNILNRRIFDHFQWSSPRTQKYLLWDTPQDSKWGVFLAVLMASPEIAIFTDGPKPLGLIWLSPLSQNSKAAFIHFATTACTPSQIIPACAQMFFAQTTMQTLLALFPQNFHHIKAFIKALGFIPLATIPHACHFTFTNRDTAATLYIRAC